jgi:hypothetical protein
MVRKFALSALFLTSLCVASFAEDKHQHEHHAPAAKSNANFDKMKKLVGTWVEADKDGKPTDKVMSIVKLTAGGSAIHETFFPGQDMEMVSVYVPEGEDLVMTHYCVIGNQPKLKADRKSPANQIVFKFAGGTNLDPKKDKHMHDATLTIVDADHLQLDGIGWENGEPAKEMCGAMKLVRKK